MEDNTNKGRKNSDRISLRKTLGIWFTQWLLPKKKLPLRVLAPSTLALGRYSVNVTLFEWKFQIWVANSTHCKQSNIYNKVFVYTILMKNIYEMVDGLSCLKQWLITILCKSVFIGIKSFVSQIHFIFVFYFSFKFLLNWVLCPRGIK